MSQRCSRLWEVEAARDGRLADSAREAVESHLRHCRDCATQQQALEDLGAFLRSPRPAGDESLHLRRLRQRILAEAQRAQFEGRRDKLAAWWRPASWRGLAAASLLAAVSFAVFEVRARKAARTEPVALRLTAAPGARFTHERRAYLEYIELLEGSLNIAFDRTRNPKADLWVRTPDGDIRDFGTTFRVSVQGGRTRELSVREGAVVFRRAGQAELVIRAGESYRGAIEAPPPTAASAPASAPGLHEREETPPPSRRSASELPHRAKPHALAHKAAAPSLPTAEHEDRAYLEVLAHLRAGRSRQAHAAAEAYLRDFPNGFRRVEVERIATGAWRGPARAF